MSTSRSPRVGLRVLQVILLIFAVGVVLFFLIYFTTIVPLKLVVLVKVAAALLVGYFAVNTVSGALGRALGRTIGEKQGRTVASSFRYLGYIALAFVVLGLAGVSGTQLLAGGTFTGLVLGLASQQVLSNALAGLLLLAARPFKVGSRITLSTWQFGFILPSYPPKYFSDNLLMPAFTGIVRDITINYTLIQSDDGPFVKLPNSLVIQAAVVDQDVAERKVRVRYEAQKPIDIDALVKAAKKTVETNEWVVHPEAAAVYVENITPNSVLISIVAFCKGSMEEPPRSSILIQLESEVQRLRRPA